MNILEARATTMTHSEFVLDLVLSEKEGLILREALEGLYAHIIGQPNCAEDFKILNTDTLRRQVLNILDKLDAEEKTVERCHKLEEIHARIA